MISSIGIELTKFVKDVKPGKDMIPMVLPVIVALASNMFFGFLAGIIICYLIALVAKDKKE